MQLDPWEAAAQGAQPAQQAKDPWEIASNAADQNAPGFIDRVSQDYDKRVATAQDLANRGVAENNSGGTNPKVFTPNLDTRKVEMGAQLVAGPIVDVANEATKSVLSGAKNAAQSIAPETSKKISDVVDEIKNSSVGKTVKAGLGYAADKYSELPQNLQDALNAGGTTVGAAAIVAPAMRAASKIGPTVGEAATATKNAAGNTVEGAKDLLTPSEPVPTSKGLFSEGDKAYAAANAAGAGAKGSAVNDFLAQANAKAAQDPQLLATFGKDEVTKYLENLNTLQGQDLPLKTAQALDINLREAAQKAYKAGDNTIGSRFTAIRQALRDNVYNQTDPAKITGGLDGFHALQEGNRLYSQGYKLESVENMINDAMTKDVPSTAIKNKFSKLAKDIAENGSQGYTPEQIAAIQAAGKTGAVTGLLKVMGNKLGPIAAGAVGGTAGFAAGGIPGSVAGSLASGGASYAATAPFRAGATALQMRRANNVLRSIADDPNFNPMPAVAAPPAPAAPQALLPPPNKMPPLPMSGAQIAAAKVKMGAYGAPNTPTAGNSVIQVVQPNRLTPGMTGNLGGDMLQKIRQMSADGKSPSEIVNFINSKLGKK